MFLNINNFFNKYFPGASGPLLEEKDHDSEDDNDYEVRFEIKVEEIHA